jgi:hypothetical protein
MDRDYFFFFFKTERGSIQPLVVEFSKSSKKKGRKIHVWQHLDLFTNGSIFYY